MLNIRSFLLLQNIINNRFILEYSMCFEAKFNLQYITRHRLFYQM